MTTIQIQETLRPTRSHDDIHNANGVYFTRTNTSYGPRTPSRTRTSSSNRGFPRTATGRSDVESNSGLEQESDFKQKQVFSGKMLAWLSYQSIGVIYGDIGTSPLYVFSSTFLEPPSYDDLLGVLSLIIWSLIMMVTVKYVLIILHADNDGEGGTFSTYSLLSRYANITNRDPREQSLIKMRRYKTGDLNPTTRSIRNKIEESKFIKSILKVIGVLAVSMVMSDGVLTPAQSVLGAVQGLNVIKPDITNGQVVGATVGILMFLYLIQPFGITKLGSTFAPIVITWLAFLGGFGIYNLIKFDYTVLKAFNPGYAFLFLIRNKEQGWRQLGGVLLAFTGVEALFADLGAFSMRAIQISWLGYTLPMLLLGYCGQAAYLSIFPEAYTNPLYNSVPPGMLYPALVVAILAAIVASQAIITATFQLITQIMKLSYFPQIKVVHTSKIFFGQVYVPMLNWLMMIGTVLVAAIYNNTTSLGNAYGVCVIFVTFFDTCMVSLAAILVWRIHPLKVIVPFLIIICMDAAFLSSALTKVPQGAWFTISLAAVLACVFILWRFGKENQWRAEAADRFKPNTLVEKRSDGKLYLTSKYGGDALGATRGFGIFFDKAGEMSPTVWIQFLTKLVAVPEVMVFFHLRGLELPTVSMEDRYTVTRMGDIPNCYRLVVRHGYMDEVITPDLAGLIFEQVRDFLIRKGENAARIQAEDEDEKFANTSNTSNDSNLAADVPLPLSPVASPTEESATNGHSTSVASATAPTTESEKPALTFRNGITQVPSNSDSLSTSPLATLQRAFDTQTLYIIGKESLKIRAETNLFKKLVLRCFIFIRENTRTKVANLRVPIEKVIEVGFVKDM
ncbi:MAG: hypothetical protein GOMPHAMPRED_003266 [Gomphillus americanus]|uniref:Potassium transporter n=1 Tax=Gomphillus americanus TaxID=1940652 RepID=A0A8H3HWQ3_9LECA|nr:MAG: hypothetical protein GOMPHAMPRED_003266 [Gomphillus americanus]